jgi:hypothetical protein
MTAENGSFLPKLLNVRMISQTDIKGGKNYHLREKKPFVRKISTSILRGKSATNVEFVLTFQLVAYDNTVLMCQMYLEIYLEWKKTSSDLRH